ncbi:MAG: sugar transferase [Pseudomonadota bacterium]
MSFVDGANVDIGPRHGHRVVARDEVGGTPTFWAVKRGFDLVFSLILLVPMLIVAAALLVLNPMFNAGPVFFVQDRMGRGCGAFRVIKFRTMSEACGTRGPDDPMERDRITPLGRWLRATRVDELPQVWNVLRGEMSLIGPRPDDVSHARVYLECVPDYRRRHSIRPGISGLAQIRNGYAEGLDATCRKVEADLAYLRHAGLGLELWIFWRTVITVLLGRGL